MNPKIQYLLDTLQAFAPVPNEIYIIHSSLFRASPIKEDLKDTYENLKEILGKNSTLCFPSFTFRNNSKIDSSWSEIQTPGEVGVLNEFVRKNLINYRSIHPTHSFSLVGERAQEIVTQSGGTAFGHDSALNQMITRGAFNISFGAPFIGGHSFLHVAEELNQVPYRSDITLNTPCELQDGRQSSQIFTYYARNVCFQNVYHENNWDIAWKEFTTAGLVKYEDTPFGMITLMKCASTIKFMTKNIKNNPYNYAQPCKHTNL